MSFFSKIFSFFGNSKQEIPIHTYNVNDKDMAGDSITFRIGRDGSSRIPTGIIRSEIPEDILKQYLSGESRDPRGYNNIGNDFKRAGDYDKAIWCYSKAIELDSSDVLPYTGRAGAYSDIGQFGNALSDLVIALEIEPQYSTALHNRGLVYLHQREPNLAIADLTQAIEVRPDYALAYLQRGKAYHYLGELERAIADYNTAISFVRVYPSAYYYKGFASLALGSYKEGIESLSFAVHHKYVPNTEPGTFDPLSAAGQPLITNVGSSGGMLVTIENNLPTVVLKESVAELILSRCRILLSEVDLKVALETDALWQLWLNNDDDIDWATFNVYDKIILLYEHISEHFLVAHFMLQFTDWIDWDWQKQHAFLRLIIPECLAGELSGPEVPLEDKLASIHRVAQEWGKRWDVEAGKLHPEVMPEIYNKVDIELI